MNFNEYEQSLIKCQYMSTVCDQLLRQLQTKALIKILQMNKLVSGQDGKKDLQKYDLIEFEYKQHSANDNKEYQKRTKYFETQIKLHEQHMKRLKNQISQLQQSRYEGTKSTRLNIRKIKQTSQLQLQSLQLRKTINFQLHNLNTLEVSNIELNEAIERYLKKQIQLKAKIKKVTEKEYDYFRCREMEENYETLLLNKRKLVEQNTHIDSQKHQQVFRKITAIAQANQNMQEMNRYEKQLGHMIKEKKFIVEEIQNREEIDKKNKLKAKISDDDDDSQIFEEEVKNLRKTIANRKFQQKANHIRTSNKPDAFLNNSTLKNSIYYARKDQTGNKNDSNYKSSIFKIEIEPVSHLNYIKDENAKIYQKEHRSSLPNEINKRPPTKSPQKLSQLPKQFLSSNKLPNFDKIEIATLEKIIKNKQFQMKQASQQTPIPFQFDRSPIDQYQNKYSNPMVKNTQQNKKLHLTEPIQPKSKYSETSLSKQINSTSATPNSRFIQEIIGSRDRDLVERLKSNVRIRTKKSQSQKYRHIEERQNLRKLHQKMINLDLRDRDSKFALSKTVQPVISHSSNTTPENTSMKEKNNKKINLSFDSIYDNEFIGVDMGQQNLSQEKQYKLKYKDKIQTLSHENSSVDYVLEKIDFLKRVKQENIQKVVTYTDPNQNSGGKNEKKEKVKVFKLSSKRKYGNGMSFDRKGKADAIQDFQSEQEFALSKIQEEEESIRNTLKSITQR